MIRMKWIWWICKKLKDNNDGVHFLLVIIDVFSRFMWVEPLENKLEDTVINAF